MKKSLIIGVLILLSNILPSAELKVITEYRYPTACQIIPIIQNDKNGNPKLTGSIVIPKDFETREVGIIMSVEVEVGRLGGLAAITDGIKLINNNTELMMVATMGDFETTKKVTSKTNINSRNKFGSTALMGASAGGFDNIVKFLLTNGADPNIQSNEGFNALQFATKNEHNSVIKLLLAHGAKS
jgi:hypothetical protein